MLTTGIDAKHDRERGVRILAKTMVRELLEQGYDERQILSLASELIGEVTARVGRSPLPDA